VDNEHPGEYVIPCEYLQHYRPPSTCSWSNTMALYFIVSLDVHGPQGLTLGPLLYHCIVCISTASQDSAITIIKQINVKFHTVATYVVTIISLSCDV